MRRSRAIALIVTTLGGLLVVAGVALIYPPAAVITAGVLLLAVGLLAIDVPPPRKGA